MTGKLPNGGMVRTTILALPLLLGILAAQPDAGYAASTAPSPHAEVSLVAESASIRPGQPFLVGLHIVLEKDWHTYWKNPGDSGLPLTIKWTLPEGFSAGPIRWPAPERLPVPPMMNYGYSGEVLFPVEITPPAHVGTQRVTIAGAFDWLECEEECVPAEAKLDLEVSVRDEPPAPGPAARLFEISRSRMPATAEGWEFWAEAGPNAVALDFRAPEGINPKSGYLFVDQPLVVDYAAPQGFSIWGHGHRLTMTPAENAEVRPGRLTGVLVVEGTGGAGDHRAVEVDVPVRAGNPTPIATTSATTADGSAASGIGSPAVSLPVALLFAFVGGLILNLMPCVLPILSLKVLGFVEQSGKHPEHARRHGIVFALGVLLSFWVLAGVMLALRAAGEQMGWGFQLQSAPFLALLCGLFLLIGLNLFGVFEFGASVMGAANLAAGRSGLAASFWNGVLATVAATPCTAPFMGTALGFALSQHAVVALSVFSLLALGMAAPYLILAFNPGLLRFVPKPGAWMETFKQFLGFLLLATVAALIWLFGQQTGVNGVGIILGGLLLVALAAWVYGRSQSAGRSGRSRAAIAVTAVALLAAGLGVALRGAVENGGVTERPSARGSGGGDKQGLKWESYSPARLAELRAEGKPVFIDFTAAWCITCQVNERVSLANSDVIERFEREGITTLRADWTRRDDQIAEALAGYGRQGVPVYVLYGRDPGGAPELLPELLTPSIVLAAIDKTLGAAENVGVLPLK